MIALHQQRHDYARFLPAVNNTYARWAARSGISSNTRRPVEGVSLRDLNFLGPKSPLFHYDGALYTAAFGVFDRGPTIISQRLRSRTFLLGDSGGFSLISGAVRVPMHQFRRLVLDWQEANCDVGVALDVPTRSLNDPRSGYTKFEACLNDSENNLKFLISSRARSDLLLLNVLQGRNHTEARAWLKRVVPYKLDGYAIAGHTRLDLHFWCKQFRNMIEQNAFDHVRHIHFLGTGEPGFGVLLTALKRALSSLVGRPIEITFDSSRAFRVAQANKIISLGLKLSSFRGTGASDAFAFRSWQLPRDGGHVGRAVPFPFNSPLGNRCTVGDFMPGVDPLKPAFDTTGLNMLSNHEVYVEIASIIQANRLADLAQADQSLVPWHIQKGVEAITGFFARSISDAWFDKFKLSLRYYAVDVTDMEGNRD
ncbi:hypothetical protein [Methylobacterium sp. SI9]|uniref:hypothetical protein n=1 Tax=Methylobacterium guangdongense TaxID=3138811 RepID=UPI00313CA5B3